MVPNEENPDEEGTTGQPATGGTGGEGQPESEKPPESGLPLPDSEGAEAPKAEEAAAAAPEGVAEGNSGTGSAEASQPSSSESSETDSGGLKEKLEAIKKDATNEAKELARKALREAVEKSRSYVQVLLKDIKMSPAQQAELKRLYIAAEKFALAGKVAVATAMNKRLDNYVSTQKLVSASSKHRATMNYLKSMLTLVTGAGTTLMQVFGTKAVNSATDLGLAEIDKLLK